MVRCTDRTVPYLKKGVEQEERREKKGEEESRAGIRKSRSYGV
jgi:hypothetical protein